MTLWAFLSPMRGKTCCISIMCDTGDAHFEEKFNLFSFSLLSWSASDKLIFSRLVCKCHGLMLSRDCQKRFQNVSRWENRSCEPKVCALSSFKLWKNLHVLSLFSHCMLQLSQSSTGQWLGLVLLVMMDFRHVPVKKSQDVVQICVFRLKNTSVPLVKF